jgi:phospholipid/cholesterol/gamma-HCH transport system substrate-binding protein
MRQFNTTAVNLRAALDDVDPLINATKPVARKLQPFTKRLRSFARDAVPTVKNLNQIINQPGQANDLIELTALQDPLAAIGVGPVTRNGKSRPGALPASAQSLQGGLPQVSTLRAYSPELIGWFDDFGHSGFPDAFGGIGRISTTANQFTLGLPNAPVPIVPCTNPIVNPLCTAADPSRLLTTLTNAGGYKVLRRCPGSNERGLSDNQLTQGGTVDCDPSEKPIGP